jgi:8-amino-7-oxononanoate synthase
MSRHPSLVERFVECVRREGCGSTGSRLLRGERDAFGQVERRFAAFKCAARSLFFSSGYLANLGVLTTLVEEGDVVLSDRANHASLIDGLRLSKGRTVVFPHNDAGALRVSMQREQSALRGRPSPVGAGIPGMTFVVVESVFGMDGDRAPLADYAEMCRSTGAVLIVDEAHAVGLYGERGSGLIEEAGLDHEHCVSINTAGKALGVAGAFVAGPEAVIDYLLQRARPFVFSTAPPPAIAGALEASLDLVEQEPERRQRVSELASFLRARLGDHGIDAGASASQIVPLVIGDNDRAVAVARAVQDQGFDVRAIRPPSVPDGTARLRVSVNAGLSRDVLDRFVQTVAVAMREAGVCSAVSL